MEVAQISKIRCIVCGNEFSNQRYMKPYDNICSSECFNDKFWFERIQDKESSKSVVINHSAYWIGDKNSKSFFRGFGGRRFKIRFFDGRYIESTNLWDNGDIPEKYLDELPDNAEFV